MEDTKIYGIIDIGSNTIRLSIYRCKGSDIKRLVNRKEMAGLAGYVKGGVMTQEGIETASRIFSAFGRLLDNLDVRQVYAFATASLRNVGNTEEAVDKIAKNTGINIEVISGEEEGILAFRGAMENCGRNQGLLVDLGGGSAELVQFTEKDQVRFSRSISDGSLSMYRRFVDKILPTEKECRAMKKHYTDLVREAYKDFDRAPVICGVGGTVRTVSKLINYRLGRPVTHNSFTAAELDEIYHFLKKENRESLDLMLKVAPDRLHTILPGIIALKAITKISRSRTVMVSTTGVREGFLQEKLREA